MCAHHIVVAPGDRGEGPLLFITLARHRCSALHWDFAIDQTDRRRQRRPRVRFLRGIRGITVHFYSLVDVMSAFLLWQKLPLLN